VDCIVGCQENCSFGSNRKTLPVEAPVNTVQLEDDRLINDFEAFAQQRKFVDLTVEGLVYFVNERFKAKNKEDSCRNPVVTQFGLDCLGSADFGCLAGTKAHVKSCILGRF
jgi:hypothetical protein